MTSSNMNVLGSFPSSLFNLSFLSVFNLIFFSKKKFSITRLIFKFTHVSDLFPFFFSFFFLLETQKREKGGKDLKESFEFAALAMFDYISEIKTVDIVDTVEISAEGFLFFFSLSLSLFFFSEKCFSDTSWKVMIFLLCSLVLWTKCYSNLMLTTSLPRGSKLPKSTQRTSRLRQKCFLFLSSFSFFFYFFLFKIGIGMENRLIYKNIPKEPRLKR